MQIRVAVRNHKFGISALAVLVLSSTASFLRSDDSNGDEGESVSESRVEEIAEAVKSNGEIFVGWPVPKLAIVFSGEMDGYLEPCGCAGLDNQKGGLKRRHSLLTQLADQDWPLVSLDMGGVVRRVGPQAEMKYRYGLKSLIEIGYQSIGFGVRELQLNADALIFAIANLDPQKNPLISSNVGLLDFENGFSKKYRIVEKAGKRIGVTSVLGKRHEQSLRHISELIWNDPEQSLRQVIDQLEQENCDLLILMAHAEPQEVRRLAEIFPQFHFVVTAGAPEPPRQMETIGGTEAQLIEVGHKAMYAMVLGIFDDPNQPYRIERVPLDQRFEDSETMQNTLIEYQKELKITGFDALGITGVKHPTDSFVGSAVCADCHTMASEEFEKTPHSHATQTLVDLDPPRQFDPECLSCHVTGWAPQEYFPYASGFLSLNETPHLTDNGCENCHGPGQSHVAAESGEVDADDAEIERLRAAMRLTILENEGNKDGQVYKEAVVVKMCMQCHDEDNSPDFDFQEYWPKVEHYGKD